MKHVLLLTCVGFLFSCSSTNESSNLTVQQASTSNVISNSTDTLNVITHLVNEAEKNSPHDYAAESSRALQAKLEALKNE